MPPLGEHERPRQRGEGRIFRRGKTWWIAYCCRLDGKVREVRESAETEDAGRAWVRLSERAQKFRGPKSDVDPRAERVPFHDLAEAFLRDYRVNGRRSLKHAERNVKRLRSYFGGRRAVDIDADQVQAYTDQRLGADAQPATINRELAALKRMFSLAVATRKGFHYRPYIPLLAEENAREGFLEPADFEAVRAHLPTDLADVATFAYLTGWRKGEVLGLEWRDVTLERSREGAVLGGTIRLRAQHSKNKRPRVVALRGALLALMERRVAARQLDCLRVFHRAGGRVPVRKAWAAACTAAGFAGLLFHDLRRSAVRNMVRAGVPERVAMRISGHRTRSVFDRYDITSEADLEAAAEQTSRYVAEKCTDTPRVVALAAGRSSISDNLSDSSSVRTERAITSR
jgi:integrase